MSEQLVTPENVTTKDGKINLLDLNRQQMREFFKDLGEKTFRADQVMKWMYHYCCDNFDEMTDINKVLRGKLKEVAEIRAPEVVEEQRSSDGTIKWAIAVGDQRVETVYIPEDDRATLCVSSQVGCALECKFCSTAQQGFNRNLRVSEIIGQVWRAAKIVGAAKVTGQRPITNVVMMGMGEPLLNLNNVVPAMEIMLDDFGFGLSKRRVTLSTSGIVSGIYALADSEPVIRLAVSLTTADPQLRQELMPVTLGNPLPELKKAISYYTEKTGKRCTLEAALLAGKNTGQDSAAQLINFAHGLNVHINLIPWNPVEGLPFQEPTPKECKAFIEKLEKAGLNVTLRTRRGRKIGGACGQLGKTKAP